MSDQLLIALTPDLLWTLIRVQAALDSVLVDGDHVLVTSDGEVNPAIAPILTQHGWTGPQYRPCSTPR